MNRREYLQSVGAVGVVPYADLSSVSDESIDAFCYIKRYEAGTVLSLSVPSGRGDYLSIHGWTANNDHIVHSPRLDEPNESDGDDDVYHFFNQEPIEDFEISITEDGFMETVETRDRCIGYNPHHTFLDGVEYLGEIDLLRIGVSDTSAHILYDLDSDYDAILWKTYDEERGEWVQHPDDAQDAIEGDSLCPPETKSPGFLRSKRLRAKGIVGQSIKPIPIIRDRQR
ncbi:hypothetical protein [Halolamina salifodinae]|uniref:Uncharacterized protein n=1 Tax=Halolamina salifodinae TaxID=1202767 RepID=A0A8T4GWY3_9EURY|nr:hypothetical protein [Halolamina salifodinae]MBP1986970.1 hypothetical protein [Halolamina salifodinae]